MYTVYTHTNKQEKGVNSKGSGSKNKALANLVSQNCNAWVICNKLYQCYAKKQGQLCPKINSQKKIFSVNSNGQYSTF